MSVYRNIGLGEPDISGVDYEDNPVTVGVAVGLDDEIRLALNGEDYEPRVILGAAETRRLIDRLWRALDLV